MKRERLILQAITSLGFKVIHTPIHGSTNGPDIWVQKKNGRPLSVEIKTARRQKSGMFQVDPVLPKRRQDDLIAIVCNEYVLIEPMADHLKAASKKGTRQMTLLLGTNP